jgi:hypothetical protein|tara:strand:+ start:4291 stop:4566 length:276 start_codon:yes stop_codon:yes gene_type:complete
MDAIKKPKHYSMAIEPATFIMKNNIAYAEGNVIKYICRWKTKHLAAEKQLEDLKKAKQYIDMIIASEFPEPSQFTLNYEPEKEYSVFGTKI